MKKLQLRLVAINAPAQAGKTTAAEFLRKNGYAVLSFATPIKQMLKALGIGDRMFEPEYKNDPMPLFGNRSVRYLMQTLGTEWGRDKVIQSIWIDLLCDTPEFAAYHGGKGMVVIDDLRFENEARFVSCLGGLVVRIDRQELPPQNGVQGHPSEQGIPAHLISRYIRNNGTLEDYYRSIAEAVCLPPRQEMLALD